MSKTSYVHVITIPTSKNDDFHQMTFVSDESRSPTRAQVFNYIDLQEKTGRILLDLASELKSTINTAKPFPVADAENIEVAFVEATVTVPHYGWRTLSIQSKILNTKTRLVFDLRVKGYVNLFEDQCG